MHFPYLTEPYCELRCFVYKKCQVSSREIQEYFCSETTIFYLESRLFHNEKEYSAHGTNLRDFKYFCALIFFNLRSAWQMLLRSLYYQFMQKPESICIMLRLIRVYLLHSNNLYWAFIYAIFKYVKRMLCKTI